MLNIPFFRTINEVIPFRNHVQVDDLTAYKDQEAVLVIRQARGMQSPSSSSAPHPAGEAIH